MSLSDKINGSIEQKRAIKNLVEQVPLSNAQEFLSHLRSGADPIIFTTYPLTLIQSAMDRVQHG